LARHGHLTFPANQNAFTSTLSEFTQIFSLEDRVLIGRDLNEPGWIETGLNRLKRVGIKLAQARFETFFSLFFYKNEKKFKMLSFEKEIFFW